MKENSRNTPIEVLPMSDDNPSQAVKRLETTLRQSLNVSMGLSDYPLLRGSLGIKSDASASTYLLEVNAAADPIQRGYLYLRAFSDIVLGHLLVSESIVYPLAHPAVIQGLSHQQKEAHGRSLLLTEKLLNGSTDGIWEEELEEVLETKSANWYRTARNKTHQMKTVLQCPALSNLLPEFNALALEDMDALYSLNQ